MAFPYPVVYQALYLYCFFSFLRISIILWIFSRHLARDDILFGPEHATVTLKWSKTIQDRKNIKTIYFPVLGSSPLCPAANLNNQPLLLIYRVNGKLVLLTDSVARKHLKQISVKLQETPLHISRIQKGWLYLGLSPWGPHSPSHGPRYLDLGLYPEIHCQQPLSSFYYDQNF